MRKISLENNKKHSFLIYIGIAFIIHNIIDYARTGTLWFEYHEVTVVDFIAFGAMICSAIIAGIIAYKLNRSVIFWVIITFFFTPISLIVLGNKKINLKPEYHKIFSKFESEYFAERAKLRKEVEKRVIDYKAYNTRLSELLNRLNSELNAELQEREIYEDKKSKEAVARYVKQQEAENFLIYNEMQKKKND